MQLEAPVSQINGTHPLKMAGWVLSLCLGERSGACP